MNLFEYPGGQTPEWRINVDAISGRVIRCCPHPKVYEQDYERNTKEIVDCLCPCEKKKDGCERAYIHNQGKRAETDRAAELKLAELNPGGKVSAIYNKPSA